jgi:hypothetical protein
MRAFKFIYLIFFFISIIFYSCSKETFNEQGFLDQNRKALSSVAVFNAIPNSRGLVLSISQNGFQKPIVTSSDQLSFGSYLTYRNWFGGDFEMFIQTVSSDRKDSFERYLSLQSGKFYSLFFYDELSLKSLLVEDNVIIPKEDNVKFRVAHLSSSVSSINLVNDKSSNVLIKALGYGNISSFQEKTVELVSNLSIKDGNNKLNVILKELIKFESKGIYTILISDEYDNGVKRGRIYVIKQ